MAAVLVERRRSMERDRGQLMDSGVVANLEADAQRLRDELAGVEADLAAVGPEAEELAAEEALFTDKRRETLASIEKRRFRPPHRRRPTRRPVGQGIVLKRRGVRNA